MMWRWLAGGAFVLAIPFVGLAFLSLFARKPANVGIPTTKLAPCPSKDNCVCSQDVGAGSFIEPFPLGVDPGRTWNALRQMLRTGERMKLVVDEPNYLHVESHTTIYRFVDDMEFVRDSASNVIHVRASARSGKYDMSANRRRIDRIRSELARVTGS